MFLRMEMFPLEVSERIKKSVKRNTLAPFPGCNFCEIGIWMFKIANEFFFIVPLVREEGLLESRYLHRLIEVKRDYEMENKIILNLKTVLPVFLSRTIRV